MALGSAVLFVGFRLFGVPVDWYPYPTLALPPLEPVLVVSCLTLALPAFVPARRAEVADL